MKFSEFVSNYGKVNPKVSEEQLFFEVVSVKIPSLNSFIAWLVLNKQIKPYLKEGKMKPIPLFNLPTSLKINYLVKSIPRISELARNFHLNLKFQNI